MRWYHFGSGFYTLLALIVAIVVQFYFVIMQIYFGH
jgi:hypothetical protein